MKKEYTQLISDYKGVLYKIGRSYTDNPTDLDDLYQEMMIQIWKSYSSFKGDASEITWVYRVCLNTALNYQKSSKRYSSKITRELDLDNSPVNSTSPEKEIIKKEKTEFLYECINELNKSDRALILLILEDHQYSEISKIMGLTINNVGVKVSRAKKKLEKIMRSKKYGF